MKISSMMVEDVVTASGEITIKEAISTLYHMHIGSIIIVDEDRKCEGIFTERDAIRVVATDVPMSTPLKEVMTTNIKTVDEEATFAEAKIIMNSHSIRHLPVTDKQGKLIGLLSFRTILDEIHNMQAVKR